MTPNYTVSGHFSPDYDIWCQPTKSFNIVCKNVGESLAFIRQINDPQIEERQMKYRITDIHESDAHNKPEDNLIGLEVELVEVFPTTINGEAWSYGKVNVKNRADVNYFYAFKYEEIGESEVKQTERRIVCAATKDSVGLVVPSVRHHDTLSHRIRDIIGYGFREPPIQGFVDNFGVFVDRFEALKIAQEANQIIKKTTPFDRLFSEDIY